MPIYLFKYKIDGEEYFSDYYPKIAISRNKQIKAAKKLFFKERNIKVYSKLMKEGSNE